MKPNKAQITGLVVIILLVVGLYWLGSGKGVPDTDATASAFEKVWNWCLNCNPIWQLAILYVIAKLLLRLLRRLRHIPKWAERSFCLMIMGLPYLFKGFVAILGIITESVSFGDSSGDSSAAWYDGFLQSWVWWIIGSVLVVVALLWLGNKFLKPTNGWRGVAGRFFWLLIGWYLLWWLVMVVLADLWYRGFGLDITVRRDRLGEETFWFLGLLLPILMAIATDIAMSLSSDETKKAKRLRSLSGWAMFGFFLVALYIFLPIARQTADYSERIAKEIVSTARGEVPTATTTVATTDWTLGIYQDDVRKGEYAVSRLEETDSGLSIEYVYGDKKDPKTGFLELVKDGENSWTGTWGQGGGTGNVTLRKDATGRQYLGDWTQLITKEKGTMQLFKEKVAK